MNKRIIISTICVTAVCILIATVLYFVPFPTKVDLAFEGVVVITEDGPQNGTLVEKLEIDIHGWEHNYLFQEDQIQLVIKTSSSNWRFAIPAGATKSRDPYIDVPYITIPTTIETSSQSSFGYYAIDLEKGYFIAGCPDAPYKFLVGSANAPVEPEAILNHFSEWIDHYFSENNT